MKKLTIGSLIGLLSIISIVAFNFKPNTKSGICHSVEGFCKNKVKSCSSNYEKPCCLKS